ncbi:MAG: hydrogenase maturation protease [Anaerolineae bacterium]|nr:hydrogenase maturation protease [Anaerolineae bacterium]
MDSLRALVLGVGNLLLGDEGVGVHVVARLAPILEGVPGVTVLDGGTLGLELLGPIEEADHLVVVDCLRSGLPRGTVTILQGEDATAWATERVTAHDLGLPSVFSLAQLRGWQASRVALVGVEPASLDPGVELSPEVEAGADEAARQVLALLREWGHDVGQSQVEGR